MSYKTQDVCKKSEFIFKNEEMIYSEIEKITKTKYCINQKQNIDMYNKHNLLHNFIDRLPIFDIIHDDNPISIREFDLFPSCIDIDFKNNKNITVDAEHYGLNYCCRNCKIYIHIQKLKEKHKK